jgi:cell wall-associated NlpC family hydrolase
MCSGITNRSLSAGSPYANHDTSSSSPVTEPAVSKAELQAGDLVFFKTGGSKRINHVGIFIGEGKFIHASTNRGITIDTVNSGTYNQCYCGARRVL